MCACQVLEVGLLIPHLEQEGAAMVLQCAQISIDVDIGLDEVVEYFPCGFDTLGV